MPKEARERQYIDDSFISLPELCLQVHMYNTGSADLLFIDDYEYAKETLQLALDNWKEERLDDKLFDDAVKNLIIATLKESRGERYV